MTQNEAELLTTIAAASLSAEEMLSFLVQSGTIDVNDVATTMKNKERNDIIAAHPYSISHGKDGRWRTWVPDDKRKEGRRMIAKSSLEKLHDALYAHYTGADEDIQIKRMTLRKLYPRWLKYKSLHTTAETYITRIESDWKKYYLDCPLVDKPIRSIRKLELDEWAHQMIRKHDMTKNMYYNASMIMRQCLEYAVDMEIIDSNPFSRVKVDGRRLFRQVKKKQNETQVFNREEEIEIFRLAWNDFYNSKRLVYRLAPLAVMFQFLTGLRTGELCAIKHSDVSSGKLLISRMLRRDTDEVVEHTKGYEDRELLLPQAALEIIEIAAAYQREHGIKTEYVFSLTSDPLKYNEINALYRKYCDKAGIPYRSSHKSRKTYISTLIDAGININTIRGYVGHSDERTTYNSYCFDRTPDNEQKKKLEEALAG